MRARTRGTLMSTDIVAIIIALLVPMKILLDRTVIKYPQVPAFRLDVPPKPRLIVVTVPRKVHPRLREGRIRSSKASLPTLRVPRRIIPEIHRQEAVFLAPLQQVQTQRHSVMARLAMAHLVMARLPITYLTMKHLSMTGLAMTHLAMNLLGMPHLAMTQPKAPTALLPPLEAIQQCEVQHP